MKTDPFNVIEKYRNPVAPKLQDNSIDATEGRIIAVKIASTVLDADIWFVLQEPFEIDDGLAVFYPEELRFLAAKDAEQLREIHKVKLAFPGSRVRQ